MAYVGGNQACILSDVYVIVQTRDRGLYRNFPNSFIIRDQKQKKLISSSVLKPEINFLQGSLKFI